MGIGRMLNHMAVMGKHTGLQSPQNQDHLCFMA
eukprot:CAMPEP_0184324384 /NCGR_PEP_ID=MMETSP1049-20130417/134888_1 /TAXON_ID=77928 /ORGANISM="Proteomonas sulcata, Strain CCMP704" /LENGTH=32 /DNA_ID= /DNA_START= /DNA_END= /DNA_ORIENTATION=